MSVDGQFALTRYSHHNVFVEVFTTQGFPTIVLEDLAKPVAAETGATMLARLQASTIVYHFIRALLSPPDLFLCGLEMWPRNI